MILPKVEFKQLDGNSEKDLFEAMTKDGSSFGYLVCLRQKYTKK